MAIIRVVRDEGFVEGVIGSSTGPFEVIHGEIGFQLSHFWFHLLRVRFTLMSRQRFLSQHELVQCVRDIEIGRVLLQLGINNVTLGNARGSTNVGQERRIELFCLQLLPINLREPRVGPDLVNAREASSATQPLLWVPLEKLRSNRASVGRPADHMRDLLQRRQPRIRY